MDIFMVIAKQLLEIITYVLILWGILQCKFKKNILIYILAVTVFVVATAVMVATNQTTNADFFYIPIDLVFIIISFEGKVSRKIVFYLVAYVNTAVINMLITSVADLIPGVDGQWFMETKAGGIINYAIGIFIILIVILLIKNIRIKIEEWIKNVSLLYFILMLIPIFFCDVLMVYLQSKESYVKTDVNKIVTFSVIFLAFFLISWSIVFISINAQKKYHKAQNSLKTKYLEIQKSNYEKIIEKDIEIKKFRHDIKGHMACIEMFLNENKISELQNYVNEVKGEMENLKAGKLSTGNDVVDAILNHMELEAKKYDINIILEGSLPNDMKIGQFDLCTIIFNSLQNSVDACKNLELYSKKDISVSFKTLNEILFIKINNPINKKLKKEIDLEKTSKKDKVNHGFGIGNIKNAVNKYKGAVTFTVNEEEFSLAIILYGVV